MSKKRHWPDDFTARDDFRIAILCALSVESDAIERLFDEVYKTSNPLWGKSGGDTNCYTMGRIGTHNVVLAYMPGIGKVNAAVTASNIRSTFKNINLALVVGVCGGAPTTPDGQAIYHGDVVVSTRILQTDFGRELTDQFIIKEPDEGNLGLAGKEIQSFLSKLRGSLTTFRLRKQTRKNAERLIADSGLEIPRTEEDVLFKSDCIHKHQTTTICNTCHANDLATCSEANALTCLQLGCSVANIIRNRDREVTAGPQIFFGAISSTDTVKKNGITRDQFIYKYNVLAFEMEGAGAWDVLPTIVVKAVCDYADSHKQKSWQQYAAVTAAAACRAIIDEWQGPLEETDSYPFFASRMSDSMRESAQRYLYALDFAKLDTRSASITPAYPMTCDWVFKTPQFSSWLIDANAKHHNRILWIKGKPGAGKSTLVKNIHQFYHRFFSQHAVAAFYFHARGEELQKSRLGMLRAILYQLLTADPRLLQEFMTAFPERRGINIEHRVWSHVELQNFLLLAVQRGRLNRTVIFIDALDECAESEARELVAFYENLAASAMVYQSSIHICFSSRHYPNIGLSKGLLLNMDTEQEHKMAIQRYVEQRLHAPDKSIMMEVFSRASNVFLWAKLVTSMLNTAFYKGSDSDEIRSQLDRIPVELNSIYKAIFQNQNNSIAQAKTVQLLQLILCAATPLSPEALYLLMNTGANSSKLRDWEKNSMSDQTVISYIFTVSRGLVEIVQSDDNKIVQFIHETVRGFLLEYSGEQEEGNMSFSTQTCNESMVRCCLASMSIPDCPRDFSDIRKFPHVKYALTYVLTHISPLLDTKQSIVILKQYCDHIAKYLWFYLRGRQKQLRGSTILRALLMSDYGEHERILTMVLANKELVLPTDQRPPTDYYSDALLAAAEKGLLGCIRILLEAGANLYTVVGDNEYALDAIVRLLSLSGSKQSGRTEHPQITLEIDEHSSDIVTQECGWVNQSNRALSLKTPVQQQVKASQLSTCTFEMLFDVFVGSTHSFWPDHSNVLLTTAVRASSPLCLKKMLALGADANSKIGTESVLVYIARTDRLPGLDQSISSQLEMATILLNHYADPDSCDGTGFPAIFYAIIQQDLRLTDLLLQHGANPLCVVRGISLLHLAAFVGFTDVFGKLLSAGLEIDRKDRSGRTPLYILMRRSRQFPSSYGISWWTPGSDAQSDGMLPVNNAHLKGSPLEIQKRLIQSMVKLIELGAYIYKHDSDSSHFHAWNKNAGAVEKILELKAHVAATQPADISDKYFAPISAHDLISLLLGIGASARVGDGRDYSVLLKTLHLARDKFDWIDREAILCIEDMAEETANALNTLCYKDWETKGRQLMEPMWGSARTDIISRDRQVDPRYTRSVASHKISADSSH